MDGIHKLDDLFTPEELDIVTRIIRNLPKRYFYKYEELGRVHLDKIKLPTAIVEKLTNLVNSIAGKELKMLTPPLCVEYSNKHGQPRLRPHFDGDFTDFIIDFQLSANTSWPLGVNLNFFDLKDNSAILFNPNTNIHWRPIKKFEDGEYVQMIFFRFYDPVNTSDYSYLPQNPADESFKEVHELRYQISEDEED